jgi:hypothetical protein
MEMISTNRFRSESEPWCDREINQKRILGESPLYSASP